MKGILFSADMANAVAEGRKTQTRRISVNYNVGDVLYVKEAWQASKIYDDYKPSEIPYGEKINYLAKPFAIDWGKKRPSLFMCGHQARSIIHVRKIRTEILNDISLGDAIAEGFNTVDEFSKKWESLYGVGSFDDRPLCVVEFMGIPLNGPDDLTIFDSIYGPMAV
ncbi:MAG: hypothetical protein WAZ19_02020 [Anaerolineae bacterium]